MGGSRGGVGFPFHLYVEEDDELYSGDLDVIYGGVLEQLRRSVLRSWWKSPPLWSMCNALGMWGGKFLGGVKRGGGFLFRGGGGGIWVRAGVSFGDWKAAAREGVVPAWWLGSSRLIYGGLD